MKMSTEGPNKGLEWTNLLLGAGLVCAAFAFAGFPATTWNVAIVGLLIVCCSPVALYGNEAWFECSNLALGCWAAPAPFLLGFGSAPAARRTHPVIGFALRRSPSSSFRAVAGSDTLAVASPILFDGIEGRGGTTRCFCDLPKILRRVRVKTRPLLCGFLTSNCRLPQSSV
ncbi:hypothetical protein [Sinorhizobium meliloti]|uniref:SPW repeat domain-containing protein n=1 Tax=Rhizobium meliloti TaxID=382 RepID=UPI000FDC6082|nr:hypothetical protein [Sinorhizobium meliloti]MDE3819617.1 hypothetical protein [Sinorhizobium meliloti]MDW9377952.1 hypothetical protein [Sinorhizobium meliloti]MDW9495811.1 hypothetical protein [Sinorhizobium meliloti]MDW9508301.1 hypothetical protein [Sinorhizobium meliloti]MDW9552786.1 hypothetical protein [Sinorhizobium meliloti]